MKKYKFSWNDDIYLIHVQFDTNSLDALENKDIVLNRVFFDENSESETKTITNNGFRFIVSRSCPEEKYVEIIYDENVYMKLFIIDDRAYYPTFTYYEG